MREALALLAEEGLENMWRRHAECADQLRAGVQKLGISLYIQTQVNCTFYVCMWALITMSSTNIFYDSRKIIINIKDIKIQ